MRHLYLFLFLFLQLFSLRGQANSDLDSLIRLLGVATDDVERVDLINDIAFEYRYEDPNLAETYAERAFKLAEEISYSIGTATALVTMGILSKNRDDFQAAEKYYKRALEIRSKLADTIGIASCYNNLGTIEKIIGNLNKAGHYFELGLHILEEGQPSKMQAILHNNYGNLLRIKGSYLKAVQHFERSIAIRRRLGDRHGMPKSLLNLGVFFQDMENFQLAEKNLKECLEYFAENQDYSGQAKCYNLLGNNNYYEGRFEKALFFYDKAMDKKEYLSRDDLLKIYANRGKAYHALGRYPSALDNFGTALDSFQVTGSMREVAASYVDLGNVYLQQAKPKLAIDHYHKALAILDTLNDVQLKERLLYNMSIAYRNLDQYKDAIDYNNQFILLKEKMFQEEAEAKNLRANLLEERVQKSELKVSLEKERRQKLYLYGIGLVLVAIIAALFALFSNRGRQIARKDAKIAGQKADLALKKVEEVLRQKELEATYARLEGQDDERIRIAKDLHDRLGAMLSTVKLYFPAHAVNGGSQAFEKGLQLLDEACEEVRRISHNLESGTLTKFGLKAQVESLVNTLNEANQLSITLNTHAWNKRLPSKMEINLYRIIQELLSNILKHAQATHVQIQLNHFDHLVNILVEDNGVGFDLDQIGDSSGMGFKNLHSRIDELGGELKIDSVAGRGTFVSVDVPV